MADPTGLETDRSDAELDALMRGAQLGDTAAQANLAYLYAGGSGPPFGINPDRALEEKWWRAAAEHGHAAAQFNLAKVNDQEAVQWIRKAAQQGIAEAEFTMGYLYHRSETERAWAIQRGYDKVAWLPQDLDAAVAWYRRAARQGHLEAQVELGRIYAEGEGASQNYAEALRWYMTAASRGAYHAIMELAYMYYQGIGVLQDYHEAARLYKALNLMAPWSRYRAEQWFSEAASLYGVQVPQDSPLAGEEQDPAEHAHSMETLGAAAESGEIYAQLTLALMYKFGKGVQQDFAKATQWFKQAAGNGHPMAQRALGSMAGAGLGMPKSRLDRIRWYRKAAEQGDVESQVELAKIYWLTPSLRRKDGRGASDAVEATTWFLLAAQQGDPEAQYHLGHFYADGEAGSRNIEESAKWRRRAAEQGHASAQCDLGRMYLEGLGVPNDPEEAARWLHRAAAQGHPRAAQNLAEMYFLGMGVSQDGAVAAIWLKRAWVQKQLAIEACKEWA